MHKHLADLLLDIYDQDVKRVKGPNKEERRAVFAALAHSFRNKRNNEKVRLQSRNKLVECNLRFARQVAHSYHQFNYLDAIQEANRGLIKAATKWNPNLGYTFITYAVWYIRQAIESTLYGSTGKGAPISLALRGIKNPESRRVWNTFVRLQSERGHEPLPEEVAAELSMPLERVNHWFYYLQRRVVYLNDIVGEDEQRIELIANHDELGPEQLAECQLELERAQRGIAKVLAQLDSSKFLERDRLIFKCYYGLDGMDKHQTLEQIGQQHDLTRERARQIIAKIWHKLQAKGIAGDGIWLMDEIVRIGKLKELTGSNETDIGTTKTLPKATSWHQQHRAKSDDLVSQEEVDSLLNLVSGHYGVTAKELLAEYQPRRSTQAIQVIIYLMREELDLSFQKIGDLLSLKVGVVAYVWKKVGQEISVDLRLRRAIANFRASYEIVRGRVRGTSTGHLGFRLLGYEDSLLDDFANFLKETEPSANRLLTFQCILQWLQYELKRKSPAQIITWCYQGEPEEEGSATGEAETESEQERPYRIVSCRLWQSEIKWFEQLMTTLKGLRPSMNRSLLARRALRECDKILSKKSAQAKREWFNELLAQRATLAELYGSMLKQQELPQQQ